MQEITAEKILEAFKKDPGLKKQIDEQLAEDNKAAPFVMPERWCGKIDLPSESYTNPDNDVTYFQDSENVKKYLKEHPDETKKIYSLFNLDHNDQQAVYISDYIKMSKKSPQDIAQLIDQSTNIKNIENLSHSNQVIDFLCKDHKRAYTILIECKPQTSGKRPPKTSYPPQAPSWSAKLEAQIKAKLATINANFEAEKEAEERFARFALSRSQNTNSAIFSSNSARAELKRKKLATQQQNDIDKLKKDIEESQGKLLESHVQIEDEFKAKRKNHKDFLQAYPIIKANVSNACRKVRSRLQKIRNKFQKNTDAIISWIPKTPERISDFCKQFTLLEKQATKDTSDFKEHANLIIRSVELMSKIAVSNAPYYIVEEFNKLATCEMKISDQETIKSLNQTLENWLSQKNTGATTGFQLLTRLLSRPAAPGRRTVKQSELNAYTISSQYREYLINFLLMNLHDTTRGMYVAPGVKETAIRNVEHYENKIQSTEQQIAATTDKKTKKLLQEKLRKQENKKEEQKQLLETFTANNEKYTKLYTLVDTELKKPENHNLIKIIYHFCKNEDMSENFKQRHSKEIAEAKKKPIIIDQELDNPAKNAAQKFIDRIRCLCKQIVVVENDIKPVAAAEPAAPPVVQQ